MNVVDLRRQFAQSDLAERNVGEDRGELRDVVTCRLSKDRSCGLEEASIEDHLRIFLVTTIMYFFNVLDKSHLGNTKTVGLDDSLTPHRCLLALCSDTLSPMI
jgi:hypothetical protein